MTTGKPLVSCTLDLHLHSSVSDGSQAPEELAKTAFRHGVLTAACTDHDSFAGSAAFRAAFEGLGGTAVSGCEITSLWHGDETHCLVYGSEHPDLVRWVDSVHAEHLAWLHRSLELVEQAGIPLTTGVVETSVGTGRVPWFGVILRLVLTAAASDPRFRHYGPDDLASLQRDWFERGRPLYVPEPEWPALDEVITRARAAGGVPVLAHPARRLEKLSESSRDIRRLRDTGLAGLEVWTTWHTAAQSTELSEFCRKHELIATQGSDFHGADVKAWAPAPGRVPACADETDAVLAALLAA